MWYIPDEENSLCHYGVKGMKRGVRRNRRVPINPQTEHENGGYLSEDRRWRASRVGMPTQKKVDTSKKRAI